MKLNKMLVVALVAPMFSACSFAFVDGPPVGYERFTPVPCTQSRTLPTLDAAFSALTMWGGTMMMLQGDEDFGDKQLGGIGRDLGMSKNGGVVTFVGAGIASGISAINGFKKVGACRDAHLEVAARREQAVAQYRDQSSGLPGYALSDALFPQPTFGDGLPVLPVTVPLLRK